MKIRSNLFSVLLLIVMVMVNKTITLNSNHFIIESNAVCTVTNELYWKMIRWYLGPLKFVDVHVLTDTSTTLSMNQLATLFLKEIADSKLNQTHQINFSFTHQNNFWIFSQFHAGLNVKVSYKILDTRFEHEHVSYSETFSWQGEKFRRRPGEERRLVYRKKRSLDTDPPTSWSKRTDEPEAGIFIIADSIKIIDDYLVGTPRRPFRFPRQIYVIAITGADEYKFEQISERLLEKMWKDYAIGNVIIITPCDGDSQVD